MGLFKYFKSYSDYVFGDTNRESICKQNIREDKIKAVTEGKEFVYNAKRHNPHYGRTSDGGPG